MSELYYTELYQACGGIMRDSFASDVTERHNQNHNFCVDLESWINVLEGANFETIMVRSALREYHFALLCAAMGQYRQAYMGLRLVLELSLAFVYFSALELNFREWLAGTRDITWQALVDVNNGVFSSRFLAAFWPELAAEAPHYRAIAEKLYRECSEYVHGSMVSASLLPETLAYSDDIFADWHEKAGLGNLLLSFVLAMRFLKKVDRDGCITLESIVLEQLGHVAEIRGFLGGVTEPNNG